MDGDLDKHIAQEEHWTLCRGGDSEPRCRTAVLCVQDHQEPVWVPSWAVNDRLLGGEHLDLGRYQRERYQEACSEHPKTPFFMARENA